MKHKWKFAVAASALLTGYASAQESDIDDAAKVAEEIVESVDESELDTSDVDDLVDEVSDAVEPEIDVPESEEIAPAFSLADYEADQTGGIVDAEAAAAAMASPIFEAPDLEVEMQSVAEDLIPADDMESVAMDSDEVEASAVAPAEAALVENVEQVLEEVEETEAAAEEPLETISEPDSEVVQDVVDEVEAIDAAEDISEAVTEDVVETVVAAEEVSQDASEADVAEDAEIPASASEAVTEVLEEAGLEIADE